MMFNGSAFRLLIARICVLCAGLCGVFVPAAVLSAEGDGTDEVALDAPIDVSNVSAPACKSCEGRGYVECGECKGSGVSLEADVPCTRCEGKGTVECKRCDEEGKVRCTKCRKRTIDDESVHAIKNPEWKEWNRKYGKDAKRDLTDPGQRGDPPPEPAEYIVCPHCDGTGRRVCPDCEGTRQENCTRCNGDGKVKGRGACPACHGEKRVPCPECAVMEGLAGLDEMKTLEALVTEKLVNPEEYFKRRRLIVARERYRQKVIAERQAALAALQARQEEEEDVEEAPPATLDQPSDEAPAIDWEPFRARMNVLLQGVQDGVIGPKSYHQKLRAIGLPAEMIRGIEADAAAESPRMKKLVDLKEAFRLGQFNAQVFAEKLDAL